MKELLVVVSIFDNHGMLDIHNLRAAVYIFMVFIAVVHLLRLLTSYPGAK
jgi:hypothetical protein